MLFAGKLLDGVLQGLSGLEGGGLCGGDLNSFASVGIAALTGGTLAHLKGTEADELHTVTSLQRVRDHLGVGVQRRLRVLLRQAGLFRDSGNEFILVHLNQPFGRVASAQIGMKECRQAVAFLVE